MFLQMSMQVITIHPLRQAGACYHSEVNSQIAGKGQLNFHVLLAMCLSRKFGVMYMLKFVAESGLSR